jgi:hypothetical protein
MKRSSRSARMIARRPGVLAIWALSIGVVACFSEPSGVGMQECRGGELGCPCEDGTCNAGLACAPSIDRCVGESCSPGSPGCTCLSDECIGGAVCDDGFCRADESTSGADPTDASATASNATSGGSTSAESGSTSNEGSSGLATSDPSAAEGPVETATTQADGTDTSSTSTSGGTCGELASCDECLACAAPQCEAECGHPSCNPFTKCFSASEGGYVERVELCCTACNPCVVDEWVTCMNVECTLLCGVAPACT